MIKNKGFLLSDGMRSPNNATTIRIINAINKAPAKTVKSLLVKTA